MMIKHIKSRVRLTPAGIEIISQTQRTHERNPTDDLFSNLPTMELDDQGLDPRFPPSDSFKRLVELNTECPYHTLTKQKGTPTPFLKVIVRDHTRALTLRPNACPTSEYSSAKGDPHAWLVWEL